MQRLPFRPNLDHLRQQAKDLLVELRRQTGSPDQIRLATSQRLLAARYGFGSWTVMKANVDRLREIEDHARRFERTHARDFPAIRPLVSVELVTAGALEHPNPVVRRLCLQLLDHVVDERGIPVLLKALDDPVPRVRRHALHALACDRCKPHALEVDVVPPLIECARRDPSEKVRFYAVAALAPRRSDARVWQTLHELVAGDVSPTVRWAAERVIEGPQPRLFCAARP
jgi:hypothetical protein